MLLSAEEVYRVLAEAGRRRLHSVSGAGLRRRAGSPLLDARVAFTTERGGETSDSQRARVHGSREGALRRSLSEAEEPAGVGKRVRESFRPQESAASSHLVPLFFLAILFFFARTMYVHI